MDDREKRVAEEEGRERRRRSCRAAHLAIAILIILLCLWRCRVQEAPRPEPVPPSVVPAPPALPAPPAAPAEKTAPAAPPAPGPAREPVPQPVPEPAPEPVLAAPPAEVRPLPPRAVIVAEVSPIQAPPAVPGPPTILGSYYEDPVGWEGAGGLQDDDFFEDFFVSGGDVVYPDGLQNPYLYINDEYYGTIKVDMRSNSPYLDAGDLRRFLGPILEKGFAAALLDGGGDFVGLDSLREKGVECRFDPNSFEVRLSFLPSQLPERSISLSYSGISLAKAENIEGLEDLRPAAFSFASNISLYGSLGYDARSVRSKALQISTSNMMGFCDLATDFTFAAGPYGASVGGFRSFFDLPDENIRVTLGSVPVWSALEPGSPFGLTVEKNYSFGKGGRIGSRYEQPVVIDEDCSIIVFINGMETFRKRVKVGLYRLKDFAFAQGSNKIEIWEVPSGVEVVYERPDPRIKITTFDMGYDSVLLAKGDSIWSVGWSFPSVEDKGVFGGYRWRDFQDRPMVAKLTDFSLALDRTSGVSDTFTFGNLAALSGRLSRTGSYALRLLDSFSLVKAFNWGTLTAGGQIQFLEIPIGGAFDWGKDFKCRLNLSNRFNAKALAPLGLALSYESTDRRLAFSASYGGGLRWLRGGVSAAGGWSFGSGRLDWSASASLSATVRKGPSATLTVATSDKIAVQPTPAKLSLGVSIPMGKNASANIRTDFSTIDASLSLKPFGSKKASVQASMGGMDPSDPLRHTSAVSASYSGSLVGISARQQFSNSYKSFSTTLSLTTALAFADGRFGMARSIPNSFLIVHPSGLIKRSPISMAKATASSSTPFRKVFGNVTYTDLAPHKREAVAVFAGDGSMFGAGGTYLLGLTPRPRQGFVKVLEANPTATVTAVLRKADGEPYVMCSSPIYSVEETPPDAEGRRGLSVEPTGDYMFTNEEGRFIQSGLAPGRYCIDLDVTGEGAREKVWHGIFFDVPVLEDSSQVVVLADHTVGAPALEIEAAGDIYEKSFLLPEVSRQDEKSFWDSLFAMEGEEDDEQWLEDGEAWPEDEDGLWPEDEDGTWPAGEDGLSPGDDGSDGEPPERGDGQDGLEPGDGAPDGGMPPEGEDF